MSKNPRKQKAKAEKQASTFGNLGGESAPAPSFGSLGGPSTSFGQVESSFGASSSFGQIESSFGGLSIGGDSQAEQALVKFAAKPNFGKLGKKVQLKTNFFKLDISSNTPNYFHYNIDISKVEDNKKDQKKEAPKKDSTPKSKKTPKHLNNLIFAELFKKHKNVFQTNIVPAFDGEKNLYSLNRFNIDGIWRGQIQIKDGDKLETFKVEITTPETSHGQTLATLRSRNIPAFPFELQALDIIMRNGPRLTKIQLGYNFFLKSDDPNARKCQFEVGRDVMKYGQFGHYQCSKIAETGIYYNVDRAMTIFTYGGRMMEAIDAILGERGSLSNPRDKNQVEDQLKGLKFKLLHLSYSRNAIFGCFSKNSVSKTMFNVDQPNGQKKQISVLEYYNTTYKEFTNRYRLNPNLPCVQVGSHKNAKYFPIEVCKLLHDEVYRRKLKPDLQGQVTRKSSQQAPFDRFKQIEDHVKTLARDSIVKTGDRPVDYLKEWGITISPQAAKVDGRVIDPPTLEYGDGKPVNTLGKGSWEMKGVKFLEGSTIGEKWGVINIHYINNSQNRTSRQRQMEDLIKKLIGESKKNGVNLSAPIVTDFSFNYRGKGSLNKDLIERHARAQLKLLIICIPSRDEIYNEIKTIAEIQHGLITQCLKQDARYWDDKFGLSNQLITNLFLKINPKTGGVNHKLLDASKPPILKKRLMIMGLDVTHPSPTDGLSKSIAAVLGSYTKELDKCFHKIIIQEKARKEVVNLKEITKFLLEGFKSKNGDKLPAIIIVYRDGIGEGDFQKIIDTELASIKAAVQEMTNDKINITYIMVQKRHNTRFLPVNAKPQDKPAFQNVAPGTVVDKDIVHHKYWEFYLCSHAGMMGTSRPTKYVVLYDDNQLDADHIQCATYYLCYLYPRCTKSSSIPPHVAYAHLMAKRGRAYLAHLDNTDGQSSIGSGNKIEKLSEAQIKEYNDNISVKEKINGRLFFI